MATLLMLLVAFGSSAPAEDLVAELPLTEGFHYDFRMYSGYLPLLGSTGKSIHYFFVESQGRPLIDPLVLWLNGGPGCSSLMGAFMENGPFYFSELNFTMYKNEYSWNKKASMLYLEAPAGVGFSVIGSSNYTNDNITAENNLEALLLWYGKFPEYRRNKFYIMGESYAGVYVPTLASQVVSHNARTTSETINLKGFAIGNPVVDYKYDGDNGWTYFLWWHGLIGSDMYENWVTNHCNTHLLNSNEVCAGILNEMLILFTEVNYYDIYRPCIYADYSQTSNKLKWRGALTPITDCVPDNALNKYMNRPDVRVALHIDSAAPPWSECTDLNYEILFNLGSIYVFPKLIAEGLRIRVYSGDTDSAVPTSGTRDWINQLNLTVKDQWSPWYMNGQVAGFSVNFKENFSFMTIKGTGHMCIEWKRPEGYHMFTSFLQGKNP